MVKVCVSSRPWVIFEQIYGSRPSMCLQDLTEDDIALYVYDKFSGSPAFNRLESNQPHLANLLRSEVVEKAEGVFLWVQIVVDFVIFGIRNQDDMAILRQRLTAMLPKLEDISCGPQSFSNCPCSSRIVFGRLRRNCSTWGR